MRGWPVIYEIKQRAGFETSEDIDLMICERASFIGCNIQGESLIVYGLKEMFMSSLLRVRAFRPMNDGEVQLYECRTFPDCS